MVVNIIKGKQEHQENRKEFWKDRQARPEDTDQDQKMRITMLATLPVQGKKAKMQK